MPVRYILSSVSVRSSIFSALSIIQYVGLYVFSLPISLVMTEGIYIVCLIIIIKSEVWTFNQTLPDIDPDAAYVVCISVSLGFRQKPSDTALLPVIALTTFNCIVSASATKGALVCFVVTVHWWRHRTHYDVTKACCELHNIPFEQWSTTRGPERNPQTLRSDGESRASIDNIYGWFWCHFLYY